MAHPLDFPQTRTQLGGLVGEIPEEVWESLVTFLGVARMLGGDIDTSAADAVALCDPLRTWAPRSRRKCSRAAVVSLAARTS